MLQDEARPIIIGEVLFDIFKDGTSVLGGAPFNVAWYLQGFGLNPLFISRIGSDPLGNRILEKMHEWGMDTQGIQTDNSRPTGTVKVALEDGEPTFDILENQAYDFIEEKDLSPTLEGKRFTLLYFGSLITRNPVSCKALGLLLGPKRLPAFVDINLRSPWWTRETVESIINRARWVKLNDAELAEVLHQPGWNLDIESAASNIFKHFDLELLIVTMGEKGAYFFTQNAILRGYPVIVDKMVDTVGAGDSFSAVVILGISRDWPLRLILQRALEFAAEVCKIHGATAPDHTLCKTFMNKWLHNAYCE